VSRKILENLVVADNDVQFSWCLTGVAVEVGDEKAEILLEMCIKKWLTIRESSFAKNILEIHKQHIKGSLGKAKALLVVYWCIMCVCAYLLIIKMRLFFFFS